MDSEIAGMIREGVAAFKAGRKDEAFALLTRVTELDERNEDAWLWLSAVVESPEDAQICLENVLAINPDNVRAQRGLAAVEKKLAEQQALEGKLMPASPGLEGPAEVDNAYGAGQDDSDSLYRGGTDGALEFAGVAYAPDDDLAGVERGGVRQSAASFDPFAVPRASGLDYDQTLDADDLDEDDDYFGDEFTDDEAALDEVPGAAVQAGYRDEQGLVSFLDDLPPSIKPTHLPGKGAIYPTGLLVGLGLLGAGIVIALVVLVLLLV